MNENIDLRKELKRLYSPTVKEPKLIKLPIINFLELMLTIFRKKEKCSRRSETILLPKRKRPSYYTRSLSRQHSFNLKEYDLYSQ